MGEVIIKCFETPGEKYFYDRHTNSVVNVSDDEYEVLKTIERGKDDITTSDILDKYRFEGLLRSNIVKEIQHPETENVEYLLENHMSQLILQVTQQCNLRCSYCAYSGNYENRQHSSQFMQYDIAKKAMDFYFARSKDAKGLDISFYGGEPLLEIDLIKKCVEYAKEKSGNKVLRFHMTTNGTLLNVDNREFLRKNKFFLTISLDGSEKEHDKNRKFRSGTGSFKIIMDNLHKLCEEDEEYYKEYVGFNAVMNPLADIGNVLDFYVSDPLFKNNRVTLNNISTTGVKNEELVYFKSNYWKAWNYEYIKLLLYMLNKLELSEVNPLMLKYQSAIQETYRILHSHNELYYMAHPGGPCIPGMRRIMVTVNGEIFPCERVSEKLECAKIGNLEEGFNYKKVKNMLNCGKMTEDECKVCWNLSQCAICIGSVTPTNNSISKEDKLKACSKSKRNTMKKIRELCVLIENGYQLPLEEGI